MQIRTQSPLITVMARAAEKAGKALARDFGEVEQLQVSLKGPGDFVTNADRRAEKTLMEELLKARPDFGFVGEEGGSHPGKGEARFIVDPIDGTMNFLHGLPHWAISIGVERQGELVAGLIFDPVKDEVFWAEKGAGAFMNAARLRVSGRRALDQALVASGFAAAARAAGDTALMEAQRKVMGRVAATRNLGSAALDLAYVAAGRLDGFWQYGLKAWDIAAGIVIVREAGGSILPLGREPDILASGALVAGNPLLAREIGALLDGDQALQMP